MFYQVNFIIFILLLGDTPNNLEVDIDYTKEVMKEEEVSGSVEVSNETESVSELEKSEDISESVEVKEGEKKQVSDPSFSPILQYCWMKKTERLVHLSQFQIGFFLLSANFMMPILQ